MPTPNADPMPIADVAVPVAPTYGRSRWVIAERTARSAGRSGVIWGYVFGAFVASSAWSYTTIYKTHAERESLAHAFGTNKATIALFGPAPSLQTVAGFTVFKVSMTAMLIGAVWALLTSTRLVRGEEEAGRWELLLSGQTTQSSAVGQALAGLGLGALAVYVLTALLTTVVGLTARVDIKAGPALFLALALIAPVLMFLAVGALTSQVAATRRQAAGLAAVFLGLCYCLRMLGDAGVGLHVLTWLSPLGWVEELHPLTAANPLPLVPILAFSAAAAALAVRLAAGRDIGASVLGDHNRATTRSGRLLLNGPVGFTLRLGRGTVAAWVAAITVVGLLLGLVAKSAGGTISGSSVKDVFTRLGAPGTGGPAFLGISYLVVAVLLAFVAAGQVSATRAEEAEGRLEHLVVRPLSRARWLTARLLVGAGAVSTVSLCAGLATWLGAATQHSGFDPGSLVAASFNAAVPAGFVLGAGALLLGWWPRGATAGIYAVLSWSLLVELIGGIGALDHWLLDTSLFHQVASAPAVRADWARNGVILGLAAACAAAGFVGWQRRDLQGA